MTGRTAKIITIGRSQAVQLPPEFQFERSEVFIRRDPKTGDIILSRKPESWDGLFELYSRDQSMDDFMGAADRDMPSHSRDPFLADPSCPGLSRASTHCSLEADEDVDGRDQPGHDG